MQDTIRDLVRAGSLSSDGAETLLQLNRISNTAFRASTNKCGDAFTDVLSISESFLQCRAFGHDWDPDPVSYRRVMGGVRETYRCLRCTTLRHEVYNASGRRDRCSYKYPPGYKLSGTDAPLYRSDYRAVLRNRQLVRIELTELSNRVSENS
jgi:hypothetical protein